jgi:2-C-methyl-D-erythritol 2,4-cyclodiphosphate synthase
MRDVNSAAKAPMPTPMMLTRTGMGQDSHRFLSGYSNKPCVLGGVVFDNMPGFQANSDGDVVYHAICNAITSLTHVLILGGIADDLCLKDGITDSEIYLKKAVETLGKQRIVHVAISLEAKRPYMKEALPLMRSRIAAVLGIDVSQVGITATSGEGLTDVGCGDGVQCFALVTTVEELVGDY